MRSGPTHVADISTATDALLAIATWYELYPTERRYATMRPEKERTVKFSRATAKDGRKTLCWK